MNNDDGEKRNVKNSEAQAKPTTGWKRCIIKCMEIDIGLAGDEEVSKGTKLAGTANGRQLEVLNPGTLVTWSKLNNKWPWWWEPIIRGKLR